MKKIIPSIIFIFYLFTFQLNLYSNSKLFLWEISKNNNKSYILGSIHAMKKNVYPLDDRIINAFNEADVLVVEINIDKSNQGKILFALKDYGFFGKDNQLKNVIPRKTLMETKKIISKIGYDIEMINKFKPWYLSLFLSANFIKSTGFSTEYGIDIYFIKKAINDKNIPIIELESAEIQFQAFDSISMGGQIKYLQYTLKNIKVQKKINIYLNQLLKAWETGDIKMMDTVINNDLYNSELDEFYQKIYLNRNITMSKKIMELLDDSKINFIIVGSGHLVGKNSILNYLIENNIKCTQF